MDEQIRFQQTESGLVLVGEAPARVEFDPALLGDASPSVMDVRITILTVDGPLVYVVTDWNPMRGTFWAERR
jgi:hypothetical protein